MKKEHNWKNIPSKIIEKEQFPYTTTENTLFLGKLPIDFNS